MSDTSVCTSTPAEATVRIHLLAGAPAAPGRHRGVDDPLGADPGTPLTSLVTSTHGDRLDVTLSGAVDRAAGQELQLVLACVREHCRRTRGAVFVDARRAHGADGTLRRFLARLAGVVDAAGATLRLP